MISKGDIVPPINLQAVTVQLPNEQIVTVDLSQKTNHPDLQWARHILLNPYSRWEIMSAFHKSLRSCQLDLALNWGKIFILKTSENVVRKYLKRIVFEETRNIDLYHKLKSDLGILELIKLFTLSKKKWQLKYYKNHFKEWNRGYETYFNKRNKGEVFDYYKNPFNKSDVSNPIDLYELNYWLQDRKDLDSRNLVFAKNMTDSKIILDYIDSKHPDFGSMYYRMVLLELLSGYWQAEGNEYFSSPSESAFFIPRKITWYFDIHTRGASKLIKSNYYKLRPGLDYSCQELDLRLSGMLIGLSFRFSTGDPLKTSWSDVEISDEDWKLLCLHEKRFYKI